MLIYGKNPILEALKNKRHFFNLYLQVGFNDSKILSLIKSNKIEFQYKNKNELATLTSNGVHQGVCGLVKDYNFVSLTDYLNSRTNYKIVILDELTDPHNIGAIIRNCECLGWDSIMIQKSTPITPVVAKSSAGGIEYITIIEVDSILKSLPIMKAKGIKVIGTKADSTIKYSDLDPQIDKIALVMGSEGLGMRKLVEMGCDSLITIPMTGHLDSLNVSVACALVLNHFQKKSNLEKDV
jgi:23S rRNA (guanosine2251-2'-O)-methyltransferase/cation-transporting ATPase E